MQQNYWYGSEYEAIQVWSVHSQQHVLYMRTRLDTSLEVATYKLPQDKAHFRPWSADLLSRPDVALSHQAKDNFNYAC